MDRVQIQEAIVSGFRPLKNGVSITLNIKQEDISKPHRELMEELWKSGDSIAGVFQVFQSEEKKPNRRGHLHMIMEEYCNRHGGNIQEEKQKLYERYTVRSRAELSDKQVASEIDRYQAGLWGQ